MALVTRAAKGVPLTHNEMDGNLTYLEGLQTAHSANANAHSQYQLLAAPVETVAFVPLGVTTIISNPGRGLYEVTCTNNTTFAFTASQPAGVLERFRLAVIDGGFSFVWPGSVVWLSGSAPNFGLGTKTFLDFMTSDGGVTWFGAPSYPQQEFQPFDADTVKTDVAQSWTAQQTFKELKDTVHTIVDGAAFEIDPANGSVQVVTLGASRTPAATNFEAGQTVLLGIDDGTAYSINWATVNPTWVKGGGSASAPTLAATGYTWILLWKVGSTIYAGEVGKP